ncbi:cyclin-T2a isoform X1 [Alosa sapidissima]|uniref:cyclin-T2a isoform X1 n=2 Tax=Alosa sapidissima TaxID=34773 RepID=UPI001C08A72A|nr:cyclin-T2a isoform X1 [Alosa sapidissima]
MAAYRGSSSKWFFTREQLESTPSRRCGVEPDRELSYRQQAANLIQDMGQRLNVSQLTINTAIVYMHRFYMYHSFTKFHRNIISPTTLFLAAKVEEQPRKLEHVIKVAHACLCPQEPPLDTKSNAYLQQAQELVILETIVLQTLGFEITIEHPHTDVVKCSQLVREANSHPPLSSSATASKDLAQTSYFMATNSLHLTTFCLQHKPTVIACVCIHLACKWSNWEIPVSTDGKHWWEYVDSSVTLELLDELTHEFLQILEKTPSRLKRIRNWRATQAAKKPKADGQVTDGSGTFTCPSLSQDHSLVDAIPGVSGDVAFSKASFPVGLSGNSGGLSLDALTGVGGTAYTYTAPSDWPQDQGHSDPLKPDTLGLQQGAAPLLPQHGPSSSHPHRPDKGAEFNPIKHEHKAGGGAKHQPPVFPAPAPPPPPTVKMTLDKYREKQAAELAGQKRRHEQQQQSLEQEGRDAYSSAALQTDHRKHLQAHLHSQLPGPGSSSLSTASPLKMKLPLPGQERSQSGGNNGGGDRREKGASLKLRLPIPAPGERSGSGSKEELKMKIKVSSERHSSSDEGAAKSKHSSPLVVKEKHRDREHSGHRHHHKHGHSHFHVHSGNGRGAHEGSGSGGALLRSPLGLAADGLTMMAPSASATATSASSSSSSSSRKRGYPESSHNHHSSKKNKSSKGSSAGGLRTSQQHPGDMGQEAGGEPRA